MSGPEDVGGLSRRAALRAGALAGAGMAAVGAGGGTAAAADRTGPRIPGADESTWPKRRGRSMMGVPFDRHRTVRVGVIGLGNRGSAMLPLFLALEGVRVTALCDVDREKVAGAVKTVTDAGQPEPATFTTGEDAYEKLCAYQELDFVYVVTPWEWHTEMALTAMRAGKHVGVECPIATSIRDLWRLVDTSEETRRHCIQLENCCYGQNELRVLRMAHEGLFGELLHGSGAYLHDLRELLFSDTYYEDEWRRAWHTRRDGDLYPTHGLGPVAAYMDINRGDRLVRMTSMSTPALGLADYRDRHVPRDDPKWDERYVNGDVTMSLLQTERGRVIHLVHGVSNPHPYSRLNHLAGTRGAFEDYPERIYLEPGASGHEWQDFGRYAEYDHWLWKDVGPGPGGHGGMDYLMLYRLAQTMRLGLAPDMDVYDAAAWNAPFALSIHSVRHDGATVPFPDFTRGEWKTPHPGTDSSKPSGG
ncbi:Gfo/Idh/MocA family oxidoreductase [Streptomyces sp. RKND-216]|uniref:Gfo/Idh/MocA family protein n=1 Tax=Streptomyces sp. RKND-216 TaxID=2562581 RepID=UPI00109E1700|nr:Gfo/Idh/MocA family oxidoreductase [Streptomyces sp. RKND-216]THA24628.1 Gfo/Idh/MocA family oxidoreductase [Streptomyces sp. RKND-216]